VSEAPVWVRLRHYLQSVVGGQVKTRLIEANGLIRIVVVFCDAWDSGSFQEEHRDEMSAHAANGVRVLFMLVGGPDSTPVPVPLRLDASAK
jgi:hypothetical protein